MNITIKIDAPELVEAVNNLAKAVGSSNSSVPAETSEAPVESKTTSRKPKPEAKEEVLEPKTKAVDPEPEAATEEPKQKKEETTVTIEDVRPILAQLTKAGKRDAVKDLFYHFGADKLSGVAEKDYPKLLEEAKKLL